ncbi:hypothetical protein ACFVVU_33855 [Kitasatospora sp. NPDC057965]|uniref:hypothetical protein n=1 Tax=Kitasatospora sp. NPDC057965 TaxID=3346291 RepID=UPI0036DB7A0A
MKPHVRTEVCAVLLIVAASVGLSTLAALLVDPGRPGVRRLVWWAVNSVALMIGIPAWERRRRGEEGDPANSVCPQGE